MPIKKYRLMVNYGLYQVPDEQGECPTLENEQKSSERNITESMKKNAPKPKPVYYPDKPLLEKAFQEYLSMRRTIKKPISTSMALNRAKNTLERLAGEDIELAIKILNQSVDHCYIGLFPLSEGKTKKDKKNILDDWRQA